MRATVIAPLPPPAPGRSGGASLEGCPRLLKGPSYSALRLQVAAGYRLEVAGMGGPLAGAPDAVAAQAPVAPLLLCRHPAAPALPPRGPQLRRTPWRGNGG